MTIPSMSPTRVTTESTPRPVTRRNQPIAMVAPVGTAGIVYLNATPFDFLVRHLVLANLGGTVATVSLYLVPPGFTAVDANAICKGYSLAANTSIRPAFVAGDVFGTLILPGWSLQATATGSVNVGGWGQELFGDGV